MNRIAQIFSDEVLVTTVVSIVGGIAGLLMYMHATFPSFSYIEMLNHRLDRIESKIDTIQNKLE